MLRSLLVVAAASGGAWPANAGDDDDDDDDDRKRRRRERSRNSLPPGSENLQAILKKVRSEFPGRIIEVELDDDDGRLVYEIKLLDSTGRLFELDVDPRNGNILKVERD
jgi:uncharacterized membrane protein YkoI